MADKDTQVEDDDAQTQTPASTEDKAVEIGKKVEAATGKEEPVPEYEVTEEGADKSPQDARLGKDRVAPGANPEHRDLTNREKRQLKKKRIAEKFDAKDARIRQQQEQINAMAARLNEVDGRLSSYDQVQFTREWNGAVDAFAGAEKKLIEAKNNGDNAGEVAAQREWYAAQKQIEALEAFKARQAAQPRVQQPQQPDLRIVNKAKEWAERNDWFRAGDKSDEDSVLADTIAVKLVSEGYDPRTDDYYEELDERLEKRGIGQRQKDDDHAPKPDTRRSPPVGGGNGRGDLGGGKVQVTLPTAYINALKENGMWDDPAKRNKMIKRYVDGLKERGEA